MSNAQGTIPETETNWLTEIGDLPAGIGPPNQFGHVEIRSVQVYVCSQCGAAVIDPVPHEQFHLRVGR